MNRGVSGFARRVERCPQRLNYCCVYCLWDGTALKIGKSQGHPKLRLESLQTGNPRRLQLLAYSCDRTEAEVHRKLRKWRLTGEWFRLGAETLREIGGWDWLDEKLFERLRQEVT